MKRLLTLSALLLLPSMAWGQSAFVNGADAEFVMHIVDEAAATPETGITAGNFTVELVQPSQHGGAQIVTNGTFADSTDWDLTGGTATISGGTLNAINETGVFAATVSTPIVQGICYEAIFTTSGFVDSTVTILLGGTAGTARSTDATFTETIQGGGTGIIEFSGGTAATAAIDNLTVYQTSCRSTASATKGADWALIERTGTGDESGLHGLLVPAEYTPVAGEYVAMVYDAGVNLALPTRMMGMAQGALDWFAIGPTTLAAINGTVDMALSDIGLNVLIAAAADLDNDPADDSLICRLLATDGDCSNFVSSTEALQALRDGLPAATVDNFETQSQSDPTGFHVNVLEIGGTAQTANDNGADINALLAAVNLLQSVQRNVEWTNYYLYLEDGDGDPATGLTDIICTTSEDGGSRNAIADTSETEIGNGVYSLTIAAGEIDGNDVEIRCTSATAAGEPWTDFVTTQR